MTLGDLSPIIDMGDDKIATGEIMDGVFPPKAKAMVKEFVLKCQKELNQMWETEEYRKLPPLD